MPVRLELEDLALKYKDTPKEEELRQEQPKLYLDNKDILESQDNIL